MSRVGKQTIEITKGTEVKLTDGTFSAKGPKGTLTRFFPGDIAIHLNEGNITLSPAREGDRTLNALWGTYASHIKNMIKGVNDGFSKKLILEGVGFKSEVAGKTLKLALGFSHPVVVEIPEGLTVTAEKNVITVSGTDKEMVGQFTAGVRAMKKPEPYKGKGFHYSDEVVRRKQGKKAA